MYDKCGSVLTECEADQHEISRSIRSLQLESYSKDARTYSVRSVRLGGVKKNVKRTPLERHVGSLIKDVAPKFSVNLSNPDLTFLCVIYENSFLFGISMHEKPSGPISRRRPRKRPVFHPSTMPPKIARCMVNLSRARPAKLFADPFCGVGGIMIEASLVGCRVIGLDASSRMVRGVRRNLHHFGLDETGVILGDARSLPTHGLDALATDPPYGRDSSTRGLKLTELLKGFLPSASCSLSRGAHICVSAPSDVDLEGYTRDAGFSIREKHLARIHRSLTRQFIVAKNS